MGLKSRVKESELYKSIFRHGYSGTARNRNLTILTNVFLHLHPLELPRAALRFSYTWGLGGISFLLFLVLTVTGVLLMFYYVPDTRRAYDDMKDLEFVVPFGLFLRNLHRWAAHAMVITVWLHMLRVFLTGAYKKPRQFNWAVGVILLVSTLLLSFSGYLLPWDQIAFWAITVGTNMATATPLLGAEGPFSLVNYENDLRFMILGGRAVGQNAMLRFYVLHCLALPLVAAVFLAVHFWRVRKDRFSSPVDPGPPAESPAKASVWPHLVAREYLAMVVVLAALVAWSIVVDAPLEEIASASNTPNPAKAPWYFVGLQEMLVYFDSWIAGVVLPGMIIVGLMLIPYVDPTAGGIGVYGFRVRPYTISVFLFGFLLWVALILIGQYFRGPGWGWYWPWESWEVAKPLYEKTWSFPLWAGLLSVGGFFGGGMLLPRLLKPALFAGMSRGQYLAVMFSLLAMLALPVKMALRLLFNVHYVLVTPWFNI
ncbi:MAG: cytochrome b N-terminal domain-containing protein [Acidobacteriota bacterium]